jgi:predicted RND superfamily exporter protein
MEKLGRFVIEKRGLILIITGLITLFFAYQVTQIRVFTKFADLLPQTHPYIQLHNDVRNKFGGANQVLIMIEVQEGDVFNTATL